MYSWRKSLKITPQIDTDTICIYDPQSRLRISIPTESFANFIVGIDDNFELLAKELKQLSLIDSAENDHHFINEWINNGWDQSLYYYASSRDISYVDDNIKKSTRVNSIRNEIESYLSSSPYPAPFRKKIDIKLMSAKNAGDYSLGEILEKRSCTDPMELLIDFSVDDLGILLDNSLKFMRDSYTLSDMNNFHSYDTMNTFGRPFRYYVISYKINGLEDGIYLYDLIDHGLSKIKLGDYKDEVVDCLIGHKSSKNSSFSIVMVADLKIWQWFYRHDRALRNLYIDAGSIMQSLLLNATALNLKTHITPASHDDLFVNLLEIKELEEQVFYTLTAG